MMRLVRTYSVVFLCLGLLAAGLFVLLSTAHAATGSIDATVILGLCGDGVINSTEECDGENLGGETCTTLGFDGGTLSCNADCTFNASQCAMDDPPPSGGGGGIIVSTGMWFSGRAYPGSTVTILQDAQIAATTIAGLDSHFQATISGLSGGTYLFAIYSEDGRGVRSSLTTFPVTVTPGATTNITGIFVAPTLDVDKEQVRRGDNIAIFGQTAPSADIVIQISSEPDFFARTVADNDGVYLYNFNTAVLEYGQHHTKSRSSIGSAEMSPFSRAVGFVVGTTNILKEAPKELMGDLNFDGRVDLIDFSIMAYWYRRPSFPPHVDLNDDGTIDLVDFSVMAFYWTG